MVHLDWAMERVDLPLVTLRISQDMSDETPLIIAGDGRVPAVFEREFKPLLRPDFLGEMRIHKPFGKKVGRRCVVGTADQSKIRSESQ